MFCLFEQLAREYEDSVGGIAHLCMVRQCYKAGVERTSDSWACDAMTRSFAAGWTTSTSLMMVAASEVTNSRPRWLIKSLLRPFYRD